VHFLDILSAIYGDFSRYVVKRVSVNYVFIFSSISLNYLDILLAIRSELSHYVVACLTVNYVDIFPRISRRIT
jgi:hypothetical protein